MAELTPMMQKYMETKEQYKDCILFYRLGDFYEMFFDDAIVASKELEIELTGKSCGLEERAPMCGIPYHAVETYLARLVSRGYKVAICEQVEDPKLAKGLVKREVIRVVTPGTNLDVQSLEASKNNYLMCIAYTSDGIGISAADVTTGDYYVTEVEDLRKLKDELMKYEPSEIICNEAFLVSGYDVEDLKSRLHMSVSSLESHMFDDDGCRRILMRHFKVNTLIGLGVEEFPTGILAAGALLQYLYDTQKTDLEHFTHISPYLTSKYMLLDSSTRRNLELTETLREKQKRGSLLWVLDKTKTAMGGRLLRNYIEQPLIDKEEMEKRLDAIQELTGEMPLVLHGGTGIPADMIKKAIDLGVSKINVNTECQLSFAAATRKYIEEGKDQQGKGYDPRKLLAPGFEAIKATVKEKMELFGSVNKA